MQRRNLAVELLNRLMSDEIKTRSRRNLVEARSFSEMLARTVDEYNNRTITAEEAIEELIELAKRIKAARERGEKLGLSEDELAFYDALGTNDSAVAAAWATRCCARSPRNWSSGSARTPPSTGLCGRARRLGCGWR